MNRTAPARILYVDDDADVLEVVAATLTLTASVELRCVNSGERALAAMRDQLPDLVLLDVNMPRMSGLEALKQIKAYDNSIICIILTAYSNVKDAVEAVRQGAYNYLEKPIKSDDLVALVDRALKATSIVKTIGLSAPAMVNAGDDKGLVGSSNEMKRIFSLIDAGDLRIDDPLALDPALASEGGIAWMFSRPGATLSVQRLLELMLTKSDNNATDVLVARAGGPQAITAFVTKLGVRGLEVDSDTAHLLYRAMGIDPQSGSFRANVEAARRADPQIAVRDLKDLPNPDFAIDPRDTSTPTAMLDLLTAYESGKALSAGSTQRLFTIMGHCETGKARIPGMLPPGTAVAHKTGSMNGIGNDVGIVQLPDGRRFAVAVFVMKDSRGHTSRDRIIAEATRAAYDYFLYAPDRVHGRSHGA